MWEKLAWFLGGLAIGGAAGYFGAKYFIEDKALAETERQVSEIKEYYEARLKSTEKAAELNELKRQYAETKLIQKDTVAPVDYNSLAEKYAGEKTDTPTPSKEKDPPADYNDDDEWGDAKRPKGAPKRQGKWNDISSPYYEEVGGHAVYPSEPTTDPYMISEESFAGENYEFEKLTLFWFVGDNVVTDEEFEPLEDLSLIGTEWQVHFGEESDPDVVHVRNPKVSCDYEIIRDKRSYATTIPE